jgi:hypothetical protein
MKISRRELMASTLASGLASSLAAQAPSPEKNQQDWLAVSAGENRRNSEALEKVGLPQATEPAFSFRA